MRLASLTIHIVGAEVGNEPLVTLKSLSLKALPLAETSVLAAWASEEELQ